MISDYKSILSREIDEAHFPKSTLPQTLPCHRVLDFGNWHWLLPGIPDMGMPPRAESRDIGTGLAVVSGKCIDWAIPYFH
jgi:hypothetical protein